MKDLKNYKELKTLVNETWISQVHAIGDEQYEYGKWHVLIYDSKLQKELSNGYLDVGELKDRPRVMIFSDEFPQGLDLGKAKNKNRFLFKSTRIEKLFIVPIQERRIDDMLNNLGSGYCYSVIIKDDHQNDIAVNYYTDREITDVSAFDFQKFLKRVYLKPDNLIMCDKGSEALAIASIKEWVKHGGDTGAIWYDESRPVAVKTCGNMYLNSRDRIVCGQPYYAKNGIDIHGEFMDGCVLPLLGAYNAPPLDCPYWNHESNWLKIEENQ